MTLRYPLPYGCVAHVVTSDDDRPPYVPPPVSPPEPLAHAPLCLCAQCSANRRTREVNG